MNSIDHRLLRILLLNLTQSLLPLSLLTIVVLHRVIVIIIHIIIDLHIESRLANLDPSLLSGSSPRIHHNHLLLVLLAFLTLIRPYTRRRFLFLYCLRLLCFQIDLLGVGPLLGLVLVLAPLQLVLVRDDFREKFSLGVGFQMVLVV